MSSVILLIFSSSKGCICCSLYGPLSSQFNKLSVTSCDNNSNIPPEKEPFFFDRLVSIKLWLFLEKGTSIFLVDRLGIRNYTSKPSAIKV